MIHTRWSRQLFLAKKNTLALSWYYITKLYNIKNQFWKVKNNYCVSSTFQAEVLTKQEYVRPFVSSSSPVKCSKDIRNLRGRKKRKKELFWVWIGLISLGSHRAIHFKIQPCTPRK